MPAVWDGLIERFGDRVPKLPNSDRIIAEGAAWIAHDGLRLALAKQIEILVADGSGRGTYVPIALAGVKMPVENKSITVANRRFLASIHATAPQSSNSPSHAKRDRFSPPTIEKRSASAVWPSILRRGRYLSGLSASCRSTMTMSLMLRCDLSVDRKAT